MENFDTIRKTQQFLIEQAKIHDAYIINNVDIKTTIDLMVEDIIEKFGGETSDEKESMWNND